jgi:hypothetical protein
MGFTDGGQPQAADRTSELTGDLAERAAAARRALESLKKVMTDAFGNPVDPAVLATDSGADLDEAVEVTRRVLALTPADHPDRGVSLSNLGNVLARRYRRNHDPADRAEALGYWREAAGFIVSPAIFQLKAASRWGMIERLDHNLPGALTASTTMVELLSLLAWHGLDWTTRAEHLADWVGTPPTRRRTR